MKLYIIFALVWIAVTITLQYIEMCKMRENWESADRFHRSYVNWEKQMVERKYKEQQ